MNAFFVDGPLEGQFRSVLDECRYLKVPYRNDNEFPIQTCTYKAVTTPNEIAVLFSVNGANGLRAAAAKYEQAEYARINEEAQRRVRQVLLTEAQVREIEQMREIANSQMFGRSTTQQPSGHYYAQDGRDEASTSIDSQTVSFTKMNEEAEAEMAEWDKLIKGAKSGRKT